MRTISVYLTRGQNGRITTDKTTWGEVRDEIESLLDISLTNFIVTENINKTNLEHREAVLPEGDFTLFVRPSKTKSGSISREQESLAKKIDVTISLLENIKDDVDNLIHDLYVIREEHIMGVPFFTPEKEADTDLDRIEKDYEDFLNSL